MKQVLAKSVLPMSKDTTKLLAQSPTANQSAVEDKEVSLPGSICVC